MILKDVTNVIACNGRCAHACSIVSLLGAGCERGGSTTGVSPVNLNKSRRHVMAAREVPGQRWHDAPDDRSKYTVAFGPSGQLTARVDCNRGRGRWKSSGSNQLLVGPLALTRAACPGGS